MRKGRPIPPLALDGAERETLEQWTRRPKTAQALALRARIVLSSADGHSNTRVAADLRVCVDTVGKWRSRFLEQGLDGLLDQPRSGRPRMIDDADVERVIALTLETTPRDATHWSTRSMAQKSGPEPHHGQPHLARLRTATSPHRNLQAVGGPPLHREGSGHCGALPQPAGPGVGTVRGRKVPDPSPGPHQAALASAPGPVERCTHDYVRHGTTSLFAALDARIGQVIGQCHRRHRALEFRKFLDTIESAVPAELDVHLIADNYATHKTALIRNWFAKRPRFPYSFHAHQRLLAEPGGALVRAAHRKAVAPWGAPEQRRTGGCHLPLLGRHQRRSQALGMDQDR